MKRREFLLKTGLGILSLSLFSNKSLANYDLSYVNNHKDVLDFLAKSKTKYKTVNITGIDPTLEFIYQRDGGDTGSVRPGVILFNDDKEAALIDVPIFAHSIEQNPTNPARIMLIPRRGPVAVEFDIVQNKVVNELSMPERLFYGHGCYIPGTDLFYASTSIPSERDTRMVLFDVKKQTFINDIIITGGYMAHQCALAKDGKHIIISFARGSLEYPPSVAWFDIATGKLTKRIIGMKENVEHFSEMSDGSILFTGGFLPTDNQRGPVALGVIEEEKVHNFPIENIDGQKVLKGQGVGILGLESRGYYFSTNLSENVIHVYNYKTKQFIKNIKVYAPRGISATEDGKFLFVTMIPSLKKKRPEILVIDVDKLEVVDRFSVKNTMAYSSHTTAFKLF